MKKLLVFSLILITNTLITPLQALSYIRDARYVCQTMGEDFEHRHVLNSKRCPAKIRNGFIETWNIAVLIARYEKDNNAKAEITGAYLSGQDEKQIIVNCPCLAKYMLDTIQKFDRIDKDGKVTKVEQIPDDSRQRLEESWINIMQQGDMTYDDISNAEIK